ncbi:hypothetical protein HK096_004796 [Nowakowskiella sp. JEL0078]|nr:hypothetical protein HK096_004796 [Nowakowskiella sp. JEL0078]
MSNPFAPTQTNPFLRLSSSPTPPTANNSFDPFADVFALNSQVPSTLPSDNSFLEFANTPALFPHTHTTTAPALPPRPMSRLTTDSEADTMIAKLLQEEADAEASLLVASGKLEIKSDDSKRKAREQAAADEKLARELYDAELAAQFQEEENSNSNDLPNSANVPSYIPTKTQNFGTGSLSNYSPSDNFIPQSFHPSTPLYAHQTSSSSSTSNGYYAPPVDSPPDNSEQSDGLPSYNEVVAGSGTTSDNSSLQRNPLLSQSGYYTLRMRRNGDIIEMLSADLSGVFYYGQSKAQTNWKTYETSLKIYKQQQPIFEISRENADFMITDITTSNVNMRHGVRFVKVPISLKSKHTFLLNNVQYIWKHPTKAETTDWILILGLQNQQIASLTQDKAQEGPRAAKHLSVSPAYGLYLDLICATAIILEHTYNF